MDRGISPPPGRYWSFARGLPRDTSGPSQARHHAAVSAQRARAGVGVTAIPLYLLAAGAGHVWLALQLYERTTGLPRDGQAFSGSAFIGLVCVALGILAAPIALKFDHSRAGLTRAALVGLAFGVLAVAYTAAGTALQGYVTGGVPGELHCIVEAGREICPPGDGTWIADARTDPFVLLLAIPIVYVIANGLGRYGPVKLRDA